MAKLANFGTKLLVLILCISLMFPVELHAIENNSAAATNSTNTETSEENLSNDQSTPAQNESTSDDESSSSAETSNATSDENTDTQTSTTDNQATLNSSPQSTTSEQQWNIDETNLTLEYDDRYTIDELGEGWKILSIETVEVTSTQVSAGKNTGTPDMSVIAQDDQDDTKLIASGVGEATVLLVQEDQYELAQELLDTSTDTTTTDESINAIELNVTVEPAKLTLIYLWGQSNAEGSCSSSTGFKRSDSVMCEEGTVYSTYAPSSSKASSIAGVSFSSSCTKSNANKFVAESLQSSKSLAGSTLEYSLDALTETGSGKTGPDSGLAYEWNQLTGDKVWIVNAAWGATTIDKWISGGTCYEKAIAVSNLVEQTYQAEIDAGHYTKGNRLMFWLQGESDKSTSTSTYYNSLTSLYNSVMQNINPDAFGVIMTRSNEGTQTNSDDISMSGSRAAQYIAGNSSTLSKLFIVSNANEQWVSDSGVKNYFSSAYPEGYLSYPTHSNVTSLPTTVSEVHSDVHYSQIGHNENGITAAKGMYAVLTGSNTSVNNVYWKNRDGSQVSALTVGEQDTATLIPVADPVYSGKSISYKTSGSAISYSVTSGTVTGKSKGSARIDAYSDNTVMASVDITVTGIGTPVLTGTTTAKSGIKVSWNSVGAASGYAIYRKTSSGSWSMIGTTSSTSYTDTSNLKSGTTYYYTVRAYKGNLTTAKSNKYDTNYWSSYDSSGIKAVYMASPTLSSAKSVSSGRKITWKSVSGASGYAVYRKASGGSWSLLATTTATSYTDKSTLTDGTTYYYTVRAYKGSENTATANKYSAQYWSHYDSSGVKATYLTAPTLSSTTKTSTGIKVSWKSVNKATGYAVYRKTSSGSFSRIAYTTSTNYTDKTAKNGKTYYYTVRAYQGTKSKATSNKYNAFYWGNYDSTGIKAVCLATPTLSSAKSVASGRKITWKSVSGASGYAVYRKASGGSWSMIGTTTSTSYTDKTTLTNGKTYYYTVRAYKGSLTTAKSNKYSAQYWGSYNASGLKAKYLAAPTLSSTKTTSSGIKVSWKSVSKAKGYAVYRKTAGGSYSRIAYTTSTSYTDKTAKSGKTYYYTVRAYQGTKSKATANKYNAFYWGNYDSAGIKGKR